MISPLVTIDTPSNLKVTAEIIGKTALAPNGDGSGKIKFTTVADNAISYKYVFSDGTSTNAPSGNFVKTFTKPGVNTYTVTVLASGKQVLPLILLLKSLFLVALKMKRQFSF